MCLTTSVRSSCLGSNEVKLMPECISKFPGSLRSILHRPQLARSHRKFTECGEFPTVIRETVRVVYIDPRGTPAQCIFTEVFSNHPINGRIGPLYRTTLTTAITKIIRDIVLEVARIHFFPNR